MSENRGKKRKKAYYHKCQNKRKSSPYLLTAKMQGVLITCNNHEKDAVKEAYNILNEYCDTLYGIEQPVEDDKSEESSKADIEQELENEINKLKQPIQRRFVSVRCRVGNCVFIKSNVPDINQLVHSILSHALETLVLKTRYCLRIVPVIATCAARQEDIHHTAEEVFGQYFQTSVGVSQTYSIVYKARNNGSVSRMDVIGDLARIIEDMNPLNQTDHDDPQYTVLVNVLCTVCCLSVVRDYTKLRKYNIHQVVAAGRVNEGVGDAVVCVSGCEIDDLCAPQCDDDIIDNDVSSVTVEHASNKTCTAECGDDAANKTCTAECGDDASNKTCTAECGDDAANKTCTVECGDDAANKTCTAECGDDAANKTCTAECGDDAANKTCTAECGDDAANKTCTAECGDDAANKMCTAECGDDAANKTCTAECGDDAANKTCTAECGDDAANKMCTAECGDDAANKTCTAECGDDAASKTCTAECGDEIKSADSGDYSV